MSEVTEHRWVFEGRDATADDLAAAGGKKEDPNGERAKLRQALRQGRQGIYLPPVESFDTTCGRVARNGVQAAALEIRELGTQGVDLRNSIAWLTDRLRYAMGERDVLEEHLRLALEEAKMHKGQREITDAALERTCKERDDLKKQLREAGKQRTGRKP